MCMVDLSSGHLRLSETEFKLPGPIPITFLRRYTSGIRHAADLGNGWFHSLGHWLRPEGDGLMYRGPDGRRIPLLAPNLDAPVINREEHVGVFRFRSDQVPWSAARADLPDELLLIQVPGPFSYLFDSRPAQGQFAWRGLGDGNGNYARVVPDDSGRPSRLELPHGSTLKLLRDRGGRLIEIELRSTTDRFTPQSLLRFEYSADNDLVGVHDAAGTREYCYRDHRLVRHRNRGGGWCESEYDAAGACVGTSGPGGVKKRGYRRGPGPVVHETDAWGHGSTYEFDANGSIVRTVDPNGGTSLFHHDSRGRLAVVVDQLGRATMIGHDGAGAASKAGPDGATTTAVLDARGRPAAFVGPAGAATEITYDDLGRVVAVRRPKSGAIKLAYASDGSPRELVTATGQTVALEWSSDYRTLKESDATGLINLQETDPLGRVVRETNARGAVRQYEYDAGVFPSVAVHPDAARREYVYDPNGRLIAVTDELGFVTRWTYDTAGRCTEVLLPSGERIRSEYDPESRPCAIQWADGSWHRFQYDPRGSLVRQEFADGRVEQYLYDAVGRMIRKTDAANAVTEGKYDDGNRLVQVRFPDGTVKTTDYDAAGNWLRITLGEHVLECERNTAGQVLVEKQDRFVLTRTFDEAGQVQTITDDRGRQVAYSYDAEGRVTSVATTAGAWQRGLWSATGATRTHAFEYDRNGNRLAWRMPSGLIERYEYDLRDQLARQTLWRGEEQLARRSYKYDATGQLVVMEDSVRGPAHFGFDALRRLRHVTRDSETVQFPYDASGNLQRNGASYGPGHRPICSAGQPLKHDPAGRVTQRGDSEKFRWTAQGLIREMAVRDEPLVRFEYDPRCRMLSKTTATRTTRYCWNQHQLWSAQSDDQVPVEFVHLPDIPLLVEQSQSGRYCTAHTDHLGRVLELRDESGVIVWTNGDGPWGEGRSRDDLPMTVDFCPFGFPGQVWEPVIGLYYNRYRFYDPATAHFWSPDPLGLDGGADCYAYPVDPVNTIDPLGLKCRAGQVGRGTFNDPTLFRGSGAKKNEPDKYCREGLTQRNADAGKTLYEHVHSPGKKGSNWVSTTHDIETANVFAGESGNVFHFHNPGCGYEVDCDPDVVDYYKRQNEPDPLDPRDTEEEIAFNKAIPPENMLGYFPRGEPWKFVRC